MRSTVASAPSAPRGKLAAYASRSCSARAGWPLASAPRASSIAASSETSVGALADGRVVELVGTPPEGVVALALAEADGGADADGVECGEAGGETRGVAIGAAERGLDVADAVDGVACGGVELT